MKTLRQQADEQGVTHQAIWFRTEKGKASLRAYRQTDKHKAYKRAYMKAYMEAYSQTEKYKAYQKAYYRKNKEKLNPMRKPVIKKVKKYQSLSKK